MPNIHVRLDERRAKCCLNTIKGRKKRELIQKERLKIWSIFITRKVVSVQVRVHVLEIASPRCCQTEQSFNIFSFPRTTHSSQEYVRKIATHRMSKQNNRCISISSIGHLYKLLQQQKKLLLFIWKGDVWTYRTKLLLAFLSKKLLPKKDNSDNSINRM